LRIETMPLSEKYLILHAYDDVGLICHPSRSEAAWVE